MSHVFCIRIALTHLQLQIGNPMSRSDLQDAILDSVTQRSHKGVKSADEDSEKIPLSLVVIGDRGWRAGGFSSTIGLGLATF